jgi:STE24 endopeptidase
MDGSRRSSKSNAFFTGFGRNKHIALFDTLMANHSVSELIAILAHEIGHFKKKHVIQGMIASILHAGILFFLLSLFLGNGKLFQAFSMEHVSMYAGLVFFGLLYTPVELVLSLLLNLLSRHNEYQADRFAAQTIPKPEMMTSALKTLAAHNLSNLRPHPFHVFLNYSHPPLLERVRAIETGMKDEDRRQNKRNFLAKFAKFAKKI